MDARSNATHDVGTIETPEAKTTPKPKTTAADVKKAQKEAAQVAAKHDKEIKGLASRIITDAKKLSTEIDAIARDVSKMGIRLHLCAASSLVHATVHGDVTLARRFMTAISGQDNKNFIRTSAYRAWFLAYGPFEYRAKAEGEKDDAEGRDLFLDSNKRKALKAAYTKNKVAFGSKLMAESPEALTPEPEWKGFNFGEELKKLVDRAESFETNQVKRMQKAGKTVTPAMRKQVNLSGITEAKKALAIIEGESGKSRKSK